MDYSSFTHAPLITYNRMFDPNKNIKVDDYYYDDLFVELLNTTLPLPVFSEKHMARYNCSQSKLSLVEIYGSSNSIGRLSVGDAYVLPFDPVVVWLDDDFVYFDQKHRINLITGDIDLVNNPKMTYGQYIADEEIEYVTDFLILHETDKLIVIANKKVVPKLGNWGKKCKQYYAKHYDINNDIIIIAGDESLNISIGDAFEILFKGDYDYISLTKKIYNNAETIFVQVVDGKIIQQIMPVSHFNGYFGPYIYINMDMDIISNNLFRVEYMVPDGCVIKTIDKRLICKIKCDSPITDRAGLYLSTAPTEQKPQMQMVKKCIFTQQTNIEINFKNDDRFIYSAELGKLFMCNLYFPILVLTGINCMDYIALNIKEGTNSFLQPTLSITGSWVNVANIMEVNIHNNDIRFINNPFMGVTITGDCINFDRGAKWLTSVSDYYLVQDLDLTVNITSFKTGKKYTKKKIILDLDDKNETHTGAGKYLICSYLYGHPFYDEEKNIIEPIIIVCDLHYTIYTLE